jgi:hypothetical protein
MGENNGKVAFVIFEFFKTRGRYSNVIISKKGNDSQQGRR